MSILNNVCVVYGMNLFVFLWLCGLLDSTLKPCLNRLFMRTMPRAKEPSKPKQDDRITGVFFGYFFPLLLSLLPIFFLCFANVSFLGIQGCCFDVSLFWILPRGKYRNVGVLFFSQASAHKANIHIVMPFGLTDCGLSCLTIY